MALTRRVRRTSASLIPSRLHTAGQLTEPPPWCWAVGEPGAAQSIEKLACAFCCSAEEVMLPPASHRHQQ